MCVHADWENAEQVGDSPLFTARYPGSDRIGLAIGSMNWESGEYELNAESARWGGAGVGLNPAEVRSLAERLSIFAPVAA